VLYDYRGVTPDSVTASADDALAEANRLVDAAANAAGSSFEATLAPLERAGTATVAAPS
jgi:hypothetical protein